MLRHAGLRVEAHGEHFAHDELDEMWLRAVGARGWVVLTHDRRMRYRPNEVAAARSAGVALLMLVGKAKTSELASSFVRMLPRVERFLDKHRPPFIAKVYRPTPADLARKPSALGRIEMWDG